MNSCELKYDNLFLKNGKPWIRDLNISCKSLVRKIFVQNNIIPEDDFFKDDSYFEEYMFEILEGKSLDSVLTSLEGLIAVLYREMCSKAELREKLKQYENIGSSPEEIQRELKNYHWSMYPEEMGR